ncbi:MAG: type II toxin-antitoxin system VapB family antitoxin [Mycobacteriales bacterium]
MTDVLIRDLSDDVLAGVDARASKLGISRVEYIRRRLAADAAAATTPVSVAQLRTFSMKIADLADPGVMDAAWR